MGDLAREILPVNIEDELKQSYLDYAMSVIVGRALPDVRDGLKPVHRRVLFAMSELNNDWNKAYKKSARVVGDVIGKYHPHGDSAVYDTIVRMAQPFSMRYMLVDGQGNFGSVDGDSAAAMRYTEIRMAKISHELLADLDKETVDFVPNYDGTEQIPEVLPTKVPTLLVNGSAGIAVGMATNIPPHNLGEIVRGCIALIDNPELGIDGLMEYIPAPDFPTGAIINGRAGILQAYQTGRGRIYLRAKYHIETNDKNGKESIIFTEIPYQVNKARLIEKIAELVKEKKLEGITELRDESDKDGMRIVIELRKGEVSEVVVNNLFIQTQLQNVFGINMVALVDGQPRTLDLKTILECFIRHRREVVTRRTVYLLRKARERGHILEGLAIALANIDAVIEMIKSSPSPAEAKERLIETEWQPGDVTVMLERAGENACRPEDLEAQYGMHDGVYHLSPAQAQAILELRLHRLTGLEHDKLIAEYRELLDRIAELLAILNSSERLMEVIREELELIVEEFGDERRTDIIASQQDFTVADLIAEEDMVVTISHGGYAKTQPLTMYQSQRRGGKGKSATAVKDEDFIEKLLIASTHDTILCFTNLGKVYWLKVYEIPQASRAARGRPIINILPLQEGERITTILPVNEYADEHYVFMATADGTVKKTPLVNFSRPRSTGLIALALDEGDTLIGAAITDGTAEVMLVSSQGKSIRFAEDDVRPMGRTARGVRGIKLAQDAKVISLIIPQEHGRILTTSINGYGKQTAVEDFPTYGRGGQGVIAMQCTDRNGELIGAVQMFEGDDVMLISDQGTLVRTRSDEISVLGRNTQGVRVIRVAEDENLVGVARIEEPEETDDELIDTEVVEGDVEVVDDAPDNPETPESPEAPLDDDQA
ncbi:DNA gyrase subunit A [Amphritea sp. 2_MG-2023]|uniref:DNA gyrase subunit A n=1 Tax=Amphritea TaxID=515417 RepID=UPI001C064B8E|nr:MULTISPECIES: DNA gyrase subunit A [Amphritea]MBU2965117.1 DNA gyrase subunit A [Amphritea atlantica]MDO6418902.1 DNA gyrase subunit A [Amphritea sp. 2_MG-2023]MDX2423238.1 DNA gyrase subunit A [Amphritea sp.]